MKTYEFDLLLKDIRALTDDQADALFAAGCDDGTPASCDGAAWIHFDRLAPSLEEAIRSAVAQVQTAGFTVSKIELDAASAVFQETEARPVQCVYYQRQTRSRDFTWHAGFLRA